MHAYMCSCVCSRASLGWQGPPAPQGWMAALGLQEDQGAPEALAPPDKGASLGHR